MPHHFYSLLNYFTIVFFPEHYLRMLDSQLAAHLEQCFVHAQLYGLRWSRLLLGREFTLENDQLFPIWDYIFACCYDTENFRAENELMEDDSIINIYSVLSNVRSMKHTQKSNIQAKSPSKGPSAHSSIDRLTDPRMSDEDKRRSYVVTPMLGILGDFILSLLLNVRTPSFSAVSNIFFNWFLQIYFNIDPIKAYGGRLFHYFDVFDEVPPNGFGAAHH